MPRSCVVCKGGTMRFITNSCYRRLPFFNAPSAPERFVALVEQTRQKYRFVVVGYVVMPEHLQLLITEPETGAPSSAMPVIEHRARAVAQAKAQRSAAEVTDDELRRAFWQARFYDFDEWSTKKRVEKLRCMHRNPVKRGLAESRGAMRRSSYRNYVLYEAGPVHADAGWGQISFRERSA
ncbi:MAG TPA: transposase [Candidatus Sulfotelmatobacter sp.]|nr:transposase [Candidatus Sulfotelmatobacter sp.]